MLKPLPFATHTFRDIIESDLLYVDKTQYVYQLIQHPKGVYFLSRPRRFGKSVLLSTLHEVFTANQQLFRGLWLAQSDYLWQSYPVIRLDFSRNAVKSAARLEQVIEYYVDEIAGDHGLTLRGFDYQSRFDNLVRQLGQRQKVVILIDEYDKPLLDNLENHAEARHIRDVLRNFYTIIKATDAYIRFVFITGISKFSRVGVFSAMNNLNDLTMHPHFATALGITEAELRTNFTDYLVDLAAHENLSVEQLLTRMRHWYNGFCFTAPGEPLYNPYSLLLCFHHRRFANFWFESGTPTFLIKLLKEHSYNVQQLSALRGRELAFSTYEIDTLSIVPLLFQTGYLTIKAYDAGTRVYTLSYPNAEVEDAFLTYLFSVFNYAEQALNEAYLWPLIEALQAQDLPRFFTILTVLFANIPYDLHIKQEKYSQSLFFLIFKLIGLRIAAEVHTNEGRIGAVIELPEHIFLFEFKLDGSTEVVYNRLPTMPMRRNTS